MIVDYICEMCGDSVDSDFKYCNRCGEFIEPTPIEEDPDE